MIKNDAVMVEVLIFYQSADDEFIQPYKMGLLWSFLLVEKDDLSVKGGQHGFDPMLVMQKARPDGITI